MTRRTSGAPHRRGFLKGMAAGGAALVTGNLWTARGQTPPNCPPAPVNGTPFSAGQDTRPILQRKSASALTSAQIAELRAAFAKLRALPSTDSRTWVMQADMHALFCQACNNQKIQSVHGTWNFFPWHRAFLYYFERILGSLVGDINYFRLPYWDWENYRSMPSIYLSPASSTNSLYDVNRYSVIASGGALPTNDGTAARISLLDGITDFTTFGGTAKAGGACESNPHDPIHDDIGLHTSPWHDMGHLGFAARDPIFFAHHCNLDKIWNNWNALAGGSYSPPGAYENPTDPAFLTERWNFYDENQKVVSISAADVLDHQNNLRYSYPTPPPTQSSSAPKRSSAVEVSGSSQARTAPLVSTYAARLIYAGNGVRPGPALEIPYSVRESVIQAAKEQSSVMIVLRGVTVPDNVMGGFDIMSAHHSGMKHVGVLAIVGDAMRMSPLPKTIVLDATDAVDQLFDRSTPARLTLVARDGEGSFMLKAQEVELRVVSRP